MTLSEREYGAEIVQLLRFLATAAAENSGWERRGVRGWHFTEEMRTIFLAGEHLRDLAQKGLVSRDDVVDPGRKLPYYVHRITQAGEDLLALHEARAPRLVPEPRTEPTAEDHATLYLSADAWGALRVLVRADDPDAWHRAADITAQSGRSFYREDGEFLIARGLAEMRLPPRTGRRNAPRTYRASALGRSARARDTSTSPTRVQIRVAGV